MRKLTKTERCKIETLHKAGMNAASIAKELGRHKSCISRELNRNSENGVYCHELADKKSKQRKESCGRIKIFDEHWSVVRALLRQKWSPEQISGWLRATPSIGFYVSDEWIYEYIRNDRDNGGNLYSKLRRQGIPYKNRRAYRGHIKDRVSIEHRPEIVDKRIRIGDWEVDSVIGRSHQSSIVTLVERSSRYTTIMKVKSKEADVVSKAIIDRAKQLNLPIHTITGDNGTEFSEHKKIAQELGIDFYFTHPYSSWEKGTNENTNGLIRQYFPKGTDFNKISDELIKKVELELNDRPRKCLGFKKPAEILAAGRKGKVAFTS